MLSVFFVRDIFDNIGRYGISQQAFQDFNSLLHAPVEAFNRRVNIPINDQFYQHIVFRTLLAMIRLRVLGANGIPSLSTVEKNEAKRLYGVIKRQYSDAVSDDGSIYRARHIPNSPILTEVALLPGTPPTMRRAILDLAFSHTF